jgi:hypothetical protein
VAVVLRIGSIVLRVDDLERQTEFWESALDYERRDEQSADFILLRPRDGASIPLRRSPSPLASCAGSHVARSHSVR